MKSTELEVLSEEESATPLGTLEQDLLFAPTLPLHKKQQKSNVAKGNDLGRQQQQHIERIKDKITSVNKKGTGFFQTTTSANNNNQKQ